MSKLTPIDITVVPDAAGIGLLRDLADALEQHLDDPDEIVDAPDRPLPFRRSNFRSLRPTRS